MPWRHPDQDCDRDQRRRCSDGRRAPPGALLALLALAGCGTEATRVPGSVRPGSIEAVTGEIQGGPGTGAGAIGGIGVVPLSAAVKPTIPLITPPKAILFYVFPRVSKDGLAWRNGVWIARVIQPFSWGVADAMEEDRLRLSSLSNLRLDEHGQLVIDRQASIEPAPRDLEGLARMATQLPWRAGASEATTRTTVIYGSSGTAVSTTAPSGSTSYLQNGGAVNLQEVQRAMQEAQERLREAQAQRARDQASGALGAPPVPGSALGSGSQGGQSSQSAAGGAAPVAAAGAGP